MTELSAWRTPDGAMAVSAGRCSAVDEVKGIQRIQSQQLEQVTGLVDDKVTSVLRGVHGRGDRLLNVLDLEQLFLLQEFQQLESR